MYKEILNLIKNKYDSREDLEKLDGIFNKWIDVSEDILMVNLIAGFVYKGKKDLDLIYEIYQVLLNRGKSLDIYGSLSYVWAIVLYRGGKISYAEDHLNKIKSLGYIRGYFNKIDPIIERFHAKEELEEIIGDKYFFSNHE